MRFNLFSNTGFIRTPFSVSLSREVVRSPYGLQWLPSSFKTGSLDTSNMLDFSFVDLKAPYSQDEQNYFSNFFARRNSYLASYNSKVGANRFYFASAQLYKRPKSNYINNFICAHSVKIPNSRIFFFRSNGFARGSFLVSALNKHRLAFFKKIRSLLFYTLFNRAIRYSFVGFRIKVRLFKFFFQSRLKKKLKKQFGSVNPIQNTRHKSPRTMNKKAKTNFFKNPYLFYFFLKSNFPRSLLSELQAFYKSDDLYVFSNARVAGVTKKYTKLSI